MADVNYLNPSSLDTYSGPNWSPPAGYLGWHLKDKEDAYNRMMGNQLTLSDIAAQKAGVDFGEYLGNSGTRRAQEFQTAQEAQLAGQTASNQTGIISDPDFLKSNKEFGVFQQLQKLPAEKRKTAFDEMRMVSQVMRGADQSPETWNAAMQQLDRMGLKRDFMNGMNVEQGKKIVDYFSNLDMDYLGKLMDYTNKSENNKVDLLHAILQFMRPFPPKEGPPPFYGSEEVVNSKKREIAGRYTKQGLRVPDDGQLREDALAEIHTQTKSRTEPIIVKGNVQTEQQQKMLNALGVETPKQSPVSPSQPSVSSPPKFDMKEDMKDSGISEPKNPKSQYMIPGTDYEILYYGSDGRARVRDTKTGQIRTIKLKKQGTSWKDYGLE